MQALRAEVEALRRSRDTLSSSRDAMLEQLVAAQQVAAHGSGAVAAIARDSEMLATRQTEQEAAIVSYRDRAKQLLDMRARLERDILLMRESGAAVAETSQAKCERAQTHLDLATARWNSCEKALLESLNQAQHALCTATGRLQTIQEDIERLSGGLSVEERGQQLDRLNQELLAVKQIGPTKYVARCNTRVAETRAAVKSAESDLRHTQRELRKALSTKSHLSTQVGLMQESYELLVQQLQADQVPDAYALAQARAALAMPSEVPGPVEPEASPTAASPGSPSSGQRGARFGDASVSSAESAARDPRHGRAARRRAQGTSPSAHAAPPSWGERESVKRALLRSTRASDLVAGRHMTSAQLAKAQRETEVYRRRQAGGAGDDQGPHDARRGMILSRKTGAQGEASLAPTGNGAQSSGVSMAASRRGSPGQGSSWRRESFFGAYGGQHALTKAAEAHAEAEAARLLRARAAGPGLGELQEEDEAVEDEQRVEPRVPRAPATFLQKWQQGSVGPMAMSRGKVAPSGKTAMIVGHTAPGAAVTYANADGTPRATNVPARQRWNKRSHSLVREYIDAPAGVAMRKSTARAPQLTPSANAALERSGNSPAGTGADGQASATAAAYLNARGVATLPVVEEQSPSSTTRAARPLPSNSPSSRTRTAPTVGSGQRKAKPRQLQAPPPPPPADADADAEAEVDTASPTAARRAQRQLPSDRQAVTESKQQAASPRSAARSPRPAHASPTTASRSAPSSASRQRASPAPVHSSTAPNCRLRSSPRALPSASSSPKARPASAAKPAADPRSTGRSPPYSDRPLYAADLLDSSPGEASSAAATAGAAPRSWPTSSLPAGASSLLEALAHGAIPDGLFDGSWQPAMAELHSSELREPPVPPAEQPDAPPTSPEKQRVIPERSVAQLPATPVQPPAPLPATPVQPPAPQSQPLKPAAHPPLPASPATSEV